MRRAEAQLRGEGGDLEIGDVSDAGNDPQSTHVIIPCSRRLAHLPKCKTTSITLSTAVMLDLASLAGSEHSSCAFGRGLSLHRKQECWLERAKVFGTAPYCRRLMERVLRRDCLRTAFRRTTRARVATPRAEPRLPFLAPARGSKAEECNGRLRCSGRLLLSLYRASVHLALREC